MDMLENVFIFMNNRSKFHLLQKVYEFLSEDFESFPISNNDTMELMVRYRL